MNQLNDTAVKFKSRYPGFKYQKCSLRTQTYITLQLLELIIITIVNDAKLLDLKALRDVGIKAHLELTKGLWQKVSLAAGFVSDSKKYDVSVS